MSDADEPRSLCGSADSPSWSSPKSTGSRGLSTSWTNDNTYTQRYPTVLYFIVLYCTAYDVCTAELLYTAYVRLTYCAQHIQGLVYFMDDDNTYTLEVLYPTVMYCTVLYCTVLNCTVLYCTVHECMHARVTVRSTCTVPVVRLVLWLLASCSCITVPLYLCVSVSLCHYFTVSLCRCVTVSLGCSCLPR